MSIVLATVSFRSSVFGNVIKTLLAFGFSDLLQSMIASRKEDFAEVPVVSNDR